MRVASIDRKKLDLLCNHIRGMAKLDIKVRRQLVEALLKECDVIVRTDIERLMCMPCAAKLAGVTRKGMHMKANRDLHIYRLCHKREREPKDKGAYVDRREVEAWRDLRASVVKN